MTPFLVLILNGDDALSQLFGQSIVQCNVATVGPKANPFGSEQGLPGVIKFTGILRPPVYHEPLPDRLTDAFTEDSKPLDSLVPEIGASVGSHYAVFERLGSGAACVGSMTAVREDIPDVLKRRIRFFRQAYLDEIIDREC